MSFSDGPGPLQHALCFAPAWGSQTPLMVMMHISQYTQKCEHKYCNAALGYNLVIKMVFLEHLYCQILFIDPHNFHTSVCKLIGIPTSTGNLWIFGLLCSESLFEIKTKPKQKNEAYPSLILLLSPRSYWLEQRFILRFCRTKLFSKASTFLLVESCLSLFISKKKTLKIFRYYSFL